MNRDLSDYRVNYNRDYLLERDLPDRPFLLFNRWMADAIKYDELLEPNAMILATVDKNGFPKSRTVLLKSYDLKGFVFYSNYSSDKGKQMDSNPNVALTFLWKAIHRQVRIEGLVEKITRDESLKYFESRPRDSQLGALVSNQSDVLESRSILEEKYKELEAKYEGKSIPLPENWGGYRVRASRFEFWQGRSSRLHDRIVYEEKEGGWTFHRLYP